ncbi:unnamed protein product, partial [Durusdinium trenchii]
MAPCRSSLWLLPLAASETLHSWNGDHRDWCWSQRPSASPDACCFRPEASSVEVQRRCWPPAMVGVAFLMCCLSVEHGRTVAARALPDVDRWREPVDVEEALRSELAEGFGPLQSAYNAKDAAVLLQLSMAIPKLWATFSATRRLASQLLYYGRADLYGHQEVMAWSEGPMDVEPGWELLWVTVMPPLLHVHIPSLPLTIARSPTPSAFGEEVTLEAFLQTHVQRVREIWEAPRMGRAQAVWELCHETARLSQSLVLLAMGPYLLQTARERAMLRVAEPPLFQNACCERYRILLWLLRDLQRELGREKLVYVEVGVSKGQTALFLLEALPWLEAYLVDNEPPDELLQALPTFASRARLVKMDSRDAADQLRSQHVDCVFLDGDHSYEAVVQDLEAWDGGDGATSRTGPELLVGHDFSWEHPGVIEAVLQHRAGQVVSLAPDHVFYWRANSSGLGK